MCMIRAAYMTVLKYESLIVLWFVPLFNSRARHKTHTICTPRQLPASVCIKALKLGGEYRRRVTADRDAEL